MGIVKYRKIWYIISGLLVLASLFCVFYYGLNVGIDFKGGSLLEVEYINNRPDISLLQKEIEGLNFGNINILSAGDKGLLVRSRNLTEEEHQALLEKLSLKGGAEYKELRFDSIGPIIGKELRQKSW
ncbi:MAG: protein translocase subunit SecF, partial [Patescibacteria group bacterium]